jgi:hypothetical protein
MQRIADPRLSGIPGVVARATVQGEILTLILLLLLPLLVLFIHRWEMSIPFAVLLVALGRSMALQTADFRLPGASLVAGAGLLYLALIIVRRPAFFPSLLLLGFAGDQLVRALDNTYDHTWQSDYNIVFSRDLNAEIEVGTLIPLVSISLIIFTILVWWTEYSASRLEREAEGYAPGLTGSLICGAAPLGRCYISNSALGLPNVVGAGRSIARIVPWLLAATLLRSYRKCASKAGAAVCLMARGGRLWALLLAFLLVVGRHSMVYRQDRWLSRNFWWDLRCGG